MHLIHLSDLHLTNRREDRLFGVDTYEHFDRVCKEIARIKTLKHIDILLVSGDITHDAEMPVYAYFLKKMEALAIPYIAIPGNHDIKTHFVQAIEDADPTYLIRASEYQHEHWMITTVDTNVEGKDHGFITQENLEKLEQSLVDCRGKRIAIFMHHHPLPVGTPLVDSCMLENTEVFLAITKKYRVNFIGSGHAHSPRIWHQDNMMLSIAPAVSFQWLAGIDEVAISEGFGFNQIDLSSDLSVTSCIY